MPFLTQMFPNVQFIVTTHSPFVISSLKNAVVYDLEKRIQVEDMTAYSFEGILNGYFGVDMYSESIKELFTEYKILYDIKEKTDEQMERFEELIRYFDTINPSTAEELVYAFREMELQRRFGADGATEEEPLT